ncbi:diguanylate cyclase domain-containing protein [Desulfogranum marinum]|uniref:diguanylate cyclase domain-containing protein n=1 Tax=Desulfogranum marinum TaxID=453220 RepID=UPI00374DA0A1
MNIEHAQSDVAPHLTLSFGIAACVPCEESSPDRLILLADEALYKAKRQGRNRISV